MSEDMVNSSDQNKTDIIIICTVRALLVTAGTIFSWGFQCGHYSREGTIRERLLLQILQISNPKMAKK